MSGRDVALTGIPRGGTTLACRLLGTCKDTVSLFEPMDVMALPACDRASAIDAIDAFFSATREGLVASGRAPSKQSGGRVPDNPYGARDGHGRRAALVERGWIHVGPPTPGFTLVVKHNAAFTALLPELAERLDTYAIVRNPVAVLASWHSLELPVSSGRAPAGERFDTQLQRRLDRTPDVTTRQLVLMDWFFEHYARCLPPERVIAYEHVVGSAGAVLVESVGLVAGDLQALSNRNANPIYESGSLHPAFDALLQADGAWLTRYSRAELEAAAAAIMDATP